MVMPVSEYPPAPLRILLWSLVRPFAPRYLMAFLCSFYRCWLTGLLIFIGAIFYYHDWIGASRQDIQAILMGLVPEFQPHPRGKHQRLILLPPEQFDLHHTSGIPQPAINPEGNLVPIVETEESGPDQWRWAIWNLKERRAVALGTWIYASSSHGPSGVDINPGVPWFLHNTPRREIFVCLNTFSFSWHPQPTIKVWVLDDRTGRLKRSLKTNFAPSGFAPSGCLMLGSVFDKYLLTLFHTTNEIDMPVIMDLDTCRVRRVPVNLSFSVFATDERLLCYREHDLFHFDLRSGKIVLPFVLEQPGGIFPDNARRYGIVPLRSRGRNCLLITSTDQSWLFDPAGPGRLEPTNLSRPKSGEQKTSDSLRSWYFFELSTGGFNLDRELLMGTLTKTGSRETDSQKSHVLFLADLKTGRKYPILDESKAHNPDYVIESYPFRTICLINDETIGYNFWGREVVFMPVSEVLKRRPLE